MKYTNFKTLALILSVFALLAFTGCESKPGTPSDSGFGSIGNIAPVAKAGADQTVTEGDTVTLNGSGSSDPDGTIVSYEWKEGSTDLSTAISFTKSDFSVGTHTITLTVTDNDGATASDSVTVTVNAVPANQAPIAKAGADQTVTEGDTVTLNGSGSSDPDGTIVSYEWKEGSTDLSTAISFTKSDFSVGTHTITLTVTDNDGATASDSVTVTVNAVPANQAPIAKAGADQTVTEGDTVTLNGSGSSDPDGTIVSYEWKEGSTDLSTAISFTKSDFTIGTHTITLTVTDNDGATASDSVTVTVNAVPANQAPIAKAGADQTVTEGDTVTLNGSGSSDPDGTISSYRWTEGTTELSTLVSFTKSDFTIGTHTITLTVTDNDGATASDDMNVIVTDAPSEAEGVLDDTFDSDGIVVDNNASGGNKNDRGKSITLDSVGNIYVTGSSHNGSNDDMAIWKYDSNGTLDSNFGNGGIVTHHNAAGGDGHDYGSSITLDSAGNIYVTGSSWGDYAMDNNDMVIWKYDSNGTLDSNFGSGGIVVDNNASGDDYHDNGYGITLDSAGKIYVTGSSYGPMSGEDMVIWKYDSTTGILDSSFGTDGIVIHHNAAGGNGYDKGYDIILDSAGKIYVTGSSKGTHDDMAIWKYDSTTGILDSSFGTSGFVTHGNAAGGNQNDIGRGITLDSAGNIYVAGDSYNGSENDMIVWKYDSSGTLDSNFGSSGLVVYDGGSTDYGLDITLGSVENIYVTGLSYNTSFNSDMVIWRYDRTAGILDDTFDTDGIVVYDSGNHDSGSGMTLNTAGNVYVTGSIYNGSNNDMAIWKYK